MKPVRKNLLKVLSRVNVNIKKNYKLIRSVQRIVNPPIARNCETYDEHILGPDGNFIPIRWFIPNDITPNGIILFFHGGGWISGDVDSYTIACNELAIKSKKKVISVDYRLAPEFPFPHGLMDCYHVAHHFYYNANKYQVKKEDFVLMGDSAGGNLVAALSLMGRNFSTFTFKTQVLIYPVTYFYHGPGSPFASVMENGEDYLLTSEKIQDYMDLYVKDPEERLIPYVSPLLSNNHKNLPDTLVISSELDPLRDEGEAYGLLLREAGNRVKIFRIKNALHGFLTRPVSDEERQTFWMLLNDFLENKELKELL